MQSVILSLTRPLGQIVRTIAASESWEPVDVERLLNIAKSHDTALFPRDKDLAWMMEKVLFAPDFYEECRRRIKESKAFQDGVDWAVLGAVLSEGVGENAIALRRIIESPQPGDDLAPALLLARILWHKIEQVIATAFPVGMDMLGVEGRATVAVDPTRVDKGIEECQELLQLLHPPGYIDDIVALNPQVVFIDGSFPRMFPLAASWSVLLKKRLPQTLFVTIDNGSDIYFSLAQSREHILRSPAFFEWFDGVVIYQDLGDLTLGDIIERLGKGADSLDGIENVACRVNGKVRFREPSPSRVTRHLGRTSLAPRPELILAQKSGSSDAVYGVRGQTFAVIIPTLQPCYWNQCRFCPTGSQRYVGRDPHLERRAEETTDLLIELAGRGVEMTFIGREVVPPSLLEGIVKGLRTTRNSPLWSYEGRFETFYTTEFIDDLAAAGCRGVIFGLESPSDRLNDLMNKYPPGMSVQQIERIISDLDRRGVAVHVNTICDLPGSTTEDVDRHGNWLKKMFDSHRYFHFNTNRFRLIPVSSLSFDPGSAGLKLTNRAENSAIPLLLTFRRDDGWQISEKEVATIWEKVFGASSWHGSSLESLHAFYHEETSCSFLEAAKGLNHFKRIKEELEHFREPGSLVLRLSSTVEIVEAESGEEADIWLVDVGGTAGWIRLSRPFWSILQVCLEEGMTFDAILTAKRPNLPMEERKEAMRILSSLCSDGFLSA